MIWSYLLPLLIPLVFLVCPIASIIFFVVSLVQYLSAKKQYNRSGSGFSSETLKKRKTRLIVSSVLAGVFVTVVVAFMVLLGMAVAFM